MVTHSAEETIAFGRTLAAELSPPLIVLLRGDLGAGKTTLVKGIAEGFRPRLARGRHQPHVSPLSTNIGRGAPIFTISIFTALKPSANSKPWPSMTSSLPIASY